MPIDDWMPEYDFSEFHRTRVRAPQEAVYTALLEADLAAHPVARLLLLLRALPSLVAKRARPRVEAFTLSDATGFGFAVLHEQAPHEIVLGLTGRFWKLSAEIDPTRPDDFRERVPDGSARVAWSFSVTPRDDGRTELATETRIRCADAATRRRFGRYWRIIRPGSGLLRRITLRLVRREAERRPARS